MLFSTPFRVPDFGLPTLVGTLGGAEWLAPTEFETKMTRFWLSSTKYYEASSGLPGSWQLPMSVPHLALLPLLVDF